MATVITNLLSAIPVFGQDLVELISFTNKINFDTILTLSEIYGLNLGVTTGVGVLPTIGIISNKALKSSRTLREEKEKYLLIPYQFIAFLVGFIDGDGYIQITKTTKGFIAIKLVIVLQLKDLSTLEYIKSVLEIGKISLSKDQRSPLCKLIINRTDLQEVLFPLLFHHNIFFLIKSRRDQFNLALHIFKQDIKYFDRIDSKKKSKEQIPVQFELPNKALDYLNLPFFKNWIIGFTVAEGSFLIKKNNDRCFQLKQITHFELFEALKLLFNTDRKIGIEDRFSQFSVSSKKDIQTVINFFSFSGLHPLTGLKGIQYLNWLNNLQNSQRYKNLYFPPAF